MTAVTITLTMDAEGFRMTGPLGDPIMCFGMLEMARVKVAERLLAADKAPERKIVDAPHGIDSRRLRVK